MDQVAPLHRLAPPRDTPSRSRHIGRWLCILRPDLHHVQQVLQGTYWYLKDEYNKRRARSNRIWESEIVRDILRAFDLMSNEERIQKFLRYSRWEPWIFAADSLVFNWKERFRMNRERSIEFNNKFKSFCDMLRMRNSPRLELDSP